jgi:uncharacterized repeat protein (TIGR01451 family)
MKIGRTFFGLGRMLAAASLLIGPMVAQAAVTVALSASNLTPVAGGGAFSYTVTLANPDAGAATNVVMTLPLPPGIWFENLTVSGAQAGAFSCVGPGVDENGSVVCRSASFVAGGAVTVDVVVTADPDLAGGIRTATARVVAGGNQNSANRQVTVQNNAGLSLALAATDSAAPGARATLLVSMLSTGSSSAINGVFSMVLPAEVQFASLYGTRSFADVCSYNPDSREVRCNMPHMPSGLHSLTVNLDVPPNQPNGSAQFSATLTAGVGSVNGSPAVAAIAISP